MRLKNLRWGFALAALLLLTAPAMAQHGRGKGPLGIGQGHDPAFAADRELFHALLRHRAEIRREVENIEHGVATLTESDNPEVAAAIQQHVVAMHKRVEEKRPIHRRDPLFAEVFRHTDQIELVYEKTAKGMRVTETSDDPYVVKLIQAHAQVVSLFVKNGFEEVHRQHELPAQR